MPVLGAGDVRPAELRAAAGRAVPGLSGGGARQRPAAGAPQLEHRVVPPRRRGARDAAAADGRAGHPARAVDPAAAGRAPAWCGEMRAAAERLLPPQFRAVMRADRRSRSCSRSTTWRAPRWRSAGWRWWAMRPSSSARTSAAAWSRRRRMRPRWRRRWLRNAEVEAALRAYEAQRIAVGRQFVAQARRLGCVSQVPVRQRGGAGARRLPRCAGAGAGGDGGAGFLAMMSSRRLSPGCQPSAGFGASGEMDPGHKAGMTPTLP